jgi:hypothetical protein
MSSTNETEYMKGTGEGQQAQIDMLALFDRSSSSIGQEFTRQQEMPKRRTKEEEKFRDSVNRNHWITASGKHKVFVPEPNPHFEGVRKFEEQTMHLRGKIFWAAFIMIVAGIACGIAVRVSLGLRPW